MTWIPGVFVILFSASIIISVFVFSFSRGRFILSKNWSPEIYRRKLGREGFTKRATAAMFVATVINFLLSSLNTGTHVVVFITSIRKALILDIDYPLLGKPQLVNTALQNLNIVDFWAGILPVSNNPSLPDSGPNLMLGEDIGQRSHCHLEGLVLLPRSTVGNPHTVCSVGWNRG